MHTIYSSDNRAIWHLLDGDLLGAAMFAISTRRRISVDIHAPIQGSVGDNEFSLWVNSRPLGVEEAKGVEESLAQIDEYASQVRIEIVCLRPMEHRSANPGRLLCRCSTSDFNGLDGLSSPAMLSGYKGAKSTPVTGRKSSADIMWSRPFAYPRDRFDWQS